MIGRERRRVAGVADPHTPGGKHMVQCKNVVDSAALFNSCVALIVASAMISNDIRIYTPLEFVGVGCGILAGFWFLGNCVLYTIRWIDEMDLSTGDL